MLKLQQISSRYRNHQSLPKVVGTLRTLAVNGAMFLLHKLILIKRLLCAMSGTLPPKAMLFLEDKTLLLWCMLVNLQVIGQKPRSNSTLHWEEGEMLRLGKLF